MCRKIEVNTEKLEECINELKQLSEKCESKYDLYQRVPNKVSDKGKTPKKMEKVINEYNTIRKCVLSLINSTVTLLENSKDGYIGVDDNA